jgi:hypothetical protein
MNAAEIAEFLADNSFNKMMHKDIKMIVRGDKGLRIQLKNIHHKLRADGTCWNRRDMTKASTLEHIQSMANAIMNNVELPQMFVQPRTGGGVQLVDGYCRNESYKIADAGGQGELWVDIRPFKGSELDALVFINGSQENEKLTDVERFELWSDIREGMRAEGLKGTLAEVAERIGVTRQRVDQVLKLGELDAEGLELVKTGQVSSAVAVAAIREHKGDGATEVLKEAVKNADGKKATTKTVAAPSVAPSLLLDMYAILAPLRSNLTKDEAYDIENYLKGEKGKPRQSDFVKVPLEEWARLTALLAEGDRQLKEKAEKAKSKNEAQKQNELTA